MRARIRTSGGYSMTLDLNGRRLNPDSTGCFDLSESDLAILKRGQGIEIVGPDGSPLDKPVAKPTAVEPKPEPKAEVVEPKPEPKTEEIKEPSEKQAHEKTHEPKAHGSKKAK